MTSTVLLLLMLLLLLLLPLLLLFAVLGTVCRSRYELTIHLAVWLPESVVFKSFFVLMVLSADLYRLMILHLFFCAMDIQCKLKS